MPIPKEKQELIDAIEVSYAKLYKDLADIDPVEAAKVALPGHAKDTQMSVANLVAYLIGWGELVLKWQEKKEKGLPVDFPETGYKWNELGLLAQKFYEDYQGIPYPQLLERLGATVNEILVFIEQQSNKALYETPWYEKYPLGRMIQLNTSSPYKNARARVRKWKKQQS